MAQSATIDGEAVCCGPDGVPDFDLLHGGRNDEAVFLQAFDLLELDGEDLRDRPLEERKANVETERLVVPVGSVPGMKVRNPDSPAARRIEEGSGAAAHSLAVNQPGYPSQHGRASARAR